MPSRGQHPVSFGGGTKIQCENLTLRLENKCLPYGELGQAERIRSGCMYRDAKAQNCPNAEKQKIIIMTPLKKKKKVFIFRNGEEKPFKKKKAKFTCYFKVFLLLKPITTVAVLTTFKEESVVLKEAFSESARIYFWLLAGKSRQYCVSDKPGPHLAFVSVGFYTRLGPNRQPAFATKG